MATFQQAEFDGTNGTLLTAYTGETGVTFADHPGTAGGTFEILNGRLKHTDGSANALILADTIPDSADYSVTADFYRVAAGPGSQMLARFDDTAVSGYFGFYSEGNSDWRIGRFDAGTATIIANSAADTLTAGTSKRAEFKLSGSTLSINVDGVQVVSVTDATYATAGRVGFRGFTDEQTHLDNWVVSTPDASAVTFDAISTQDNITTGTQRSLTFSHTASGTNRVVYVAVAGDSNGWNGVFESVTYGGVNLGAAVVSTVGEGGRDLAIFEYINPPTTAENVVITFDSGSAAQEMIGAAFSFSGVSQVNPRRTALKETGDTVTSISLAPTSSIRDRLVNFLNLNNATVGEATPTSGQIERAFHNMNGGGGIGLWVMDDLGEKGSTNLNWDIVSGFYSHIGFALRPPGPVITGNPASAASGEQNVTINVEDSSIIDTATYGGVDLTASIVVVDTTTITVDFPVYYSNGLDFKAHAFELADVGGNTDSVQIALTLPASVDYYRTVAGYPPGGDEITFFDDAGITAVDGDKFTIRDPSAIVLNVFNYGGFDADTLDSVFVRHLDISDTTDGPDGTWTNELEFSATSIDNLVDIGAIAQASTATITFDNAGSFFFTAEIQAQEATGDADFLLSGSNTIDANSQAQAATATLTLEMSQQMFAQVQAQAATAPFTLFSQSREINMDVTAQAASAGMKFRVPITWIFEPDNFSGS